MKYTRKKIVSQLKKEYGKIITGTRVHQILIEVGMENVDYAKIHKRLIIVAESGYQKIVLRLKLQKITPLKDSPECTEISSKNS